MENYEGERESVLSVIKYRSRQNHTSIKLL